MLLVSIDLKYTQIFRELQKSTARATHTKQATSSARRNTVLVKWYQHHSKNIDALGVTDFRQTRTAQKSLFTHWGLDVGVRIRKLREVTRNVRWMRLVLSGCQGFGSHGLVCHRSCSYKTCTHRSGSFVLPRVPHNVLPKGSKDYLTRLSYMGRAKLSGGFSRATRKLKQRGHSSTNYTATTYISCIRRERISHIRAVMTILWERLAYAGSVSTLNPEIQKRKRKSHQEFILLKIPSLTLLQNSSEGSKLHEKENQNRGCHTNTRNVRDRFSYQGRQLELVGPSTTHPFPPE